MKLPFITMFLLGAFSAAAQFDPAAGKAGSLAMHKDSTAFINWGKACTVQRGLMDLSDVSLGRVTYGSEGAGEGKPDQVVVSLGDKGMAIVEFHQPIKNGEGPDFAVFENSLWNDFLELAFVEVSSDGKKYFRFPAVSLTDTSKQVGGFGKINPTKISNLAGKYRADYGTPFDLELLKDSSGLDVDLVTHVRIIDVIGNIDAKYDRSRDSKGVLINDPFPTGFETGGFDLDGVGVIHENPVHIEHSPTMAQTLQVNVIGSTLLASIPETTGQFSVIGIDGSVIYTQNASGHEGTLHINGLSMRQGIYLATYRHSKGVITQKFEVW